MWPTMALAEIAEVVGGSTPKTGTPEYWNGDIPWVTPADLSRLDGHYIGDTPRKITESGLSSSGARILPVGSVLLSSRAPIGHVAITTVPMATNQGFKSLIPDSRQADAKYLYWWLYSNKTYLQGLGNGATFKEVSKATVGKVRVPLPPLPEQRRIAAILDQTDALRTTRRRTLTLLDELTDSIFTDMFGRVFDRESRPFADLLLMQLRNGVSPSNSGMVTAPVLTLSAITRGRFDPSATKYSTFKKKHDPSKIVQAGEMLICRGNGNRHLVGRAEIAVDVGSSVAFPDTMIAARLNPALVTAAFIRAAWNRRSIRKQVEAGARTTNGTYKINQQTLSTINVPTPPIGLQQTYSDRIRKLDSLRGSIHEQLTSLEELFTAFQLEAFSMEY